MNPYEVLGVGEAATDEAIRQAYRHKSKTAHPDAPNGSEEKFTELRLAFDVLSDPDRRRRYDRTGEINPTDADNFVPMIMDLLVRMLDQVLQAEIDDDQLFGMDLVGELTRCVQDEIAVIHEKIEPTDTALRRIARLKKRLKRKAKRGAEEQPNELLKLLLGREVDYLHARKAADRDLEVRQKAIEMLQDYRYDRSSDVDIEELLGRHQGAVALGKFFIPKFG